eukprot:scaffold45555_cov52-Attheya_sp.AAC.5
MLLYPRPQIHSGRRSRLHVGLPYVRSALAILRGVFARDAVVAPEVSILVPSFVVYCSIVPGFTMLGVADPLAKKEEPAKK